MSYHEFYNKVHKRFKGDIIRIFHEDGKHIAKLVGGVCLVGNPGTPSVCVKWGSGHSAIATL